VLIISACDTQYFHILQLTAQTWMALFWLMRVAQEESAI